MRKSERRSHKKAACSAKAKLRVEKSCILKRKFQNQSQGLNSSFKNVPQRGKALKKVLEALSNLQNEIQVLFILLSNFIKYSKLYGLS